jgi:hypothetical protein
MSGLSWFGGTLNVYERKGGYTPVKSLMTRSLEEAQEELNKFPDETHYGVYTPYTLSMRSETCKPSATHTP